MATTPTAPVQVRPGDGSDPARAGHIGRIVAGSLATGLIAALLLVAAPFISPEENDVTGAVLCGFAVGWAMLAILSSRYTDQPQRWAAAPALFMGLGGLLLIGFGSSSREVLNWVWPPALLALVIWMFVQARRQLHSRSRRWLLYPVLAVLAVASVGGGYETVREARGCQRIPDVGSADRRRRTPPAPQLHRLRQPHRRPPTGRRRLLLGHGVDSARRSRRYAGLRLRPSGSRLERATRQPPGRHPDSK